MYINRKWLYINVWALVLNGLLVCLTVFNQFPGLLLIGFFVVSLGGFVLLSYKVNRPLK